MKENTKKYKNNKEYKSFCYKRYGAFFSYLNNNKDIKYSFNNKNITLRIKSSTKYIEFNNIEIPPNIKIKLNNKQIVIIKHYPKKYLSDNLHILGTLVINGFHDADPNLSKLHYFGKNTYVINLIAQATTLKSLKNITIKKELDLKSSQIISKLPDNLILDGDLNISYSSIKKLGKNTTIKGNLDAKYSKLEGLPDNLSVMGVLDVSYCSIKKLGKNIFIGQWAYFYFTNIDKLGKNFTIKKELNLNFSKIKKLSNNLSINKLNISNTEINKIPDCLINHLKRISFNGILKNVDKFYDENIEILCCDFKLSKHYIINHKILKIDNDYIKKTYVKNALLYNSLPFQKKLLLEEFNKITLKEINQYILNKNKIIKKRYNLSSTRKYLKVIKGEVPFIYYCQSKQAFEFIYQKGYCFTEKELNFIQDVDLKNLYEIYLLKYNLLN